MKSFLRFLCYLPVLFLGVLGTIVVVDMWHLANGGRPKVDVVKDKDEGPKADVTSSAKGDATPAAQ